MKTALCLFGVVGGTTGKAGQSLASTDVLKIGAEYYHKNLIDLNNTDVFVHTWNVDLQKQIEKRYTPKNAIFETQKTFVIPPYVRGNLQRKQNHYSRWYSSAKAIELAIQYDKYDTIMVSRFDIAWSKPVNFADYQNDNFYVGQWSTLLQNGQDLFQGGRGKIYEQPELVKQCIYMLKGYPYDKSGLLDFWFFSNQKNMEEFAKLYNNLDEYNRPDQCPADHAGNISSHQLSLYHLSKIGLKEKITEADFRLYDDFPLIRRKFFKCKR